MSRSFRRRALPRVGFGVLLAVGLVGLAEGGARVAGVAAYAPETAVLGRAVPAHEAGRLVDQAAPMPDFHVTTNGDGLRTAIGRARTPGVRRVAVTGDSTVFGWGVEVEDSVPGRLGTVLGAGWEVVDAGQPGFSGVQVARLVADVVAAYTPDVFVYVQPWHDVNTAIRTDRDVLDGAPLPWPTRIRMASRLYALAHPTVRTPGPQRPPDPTALARGDRVMRVPPADRKAALDAMRAALPDAAFFVALFPTDGDLRRGFHPGGPFDAELAAWAADNGATFLNLRDAFPGAALEDVTVPGDPGHFDGDGAQVLAERIVTAIR